MTSAYLSFSTKRSAASSKWRCHDEEKTFSIKTYINIDQKQKLFPLTTLAAMKLIMKRPPSISLLLKGAHWMMICILRLKQVTKIGVHLCAQCMQTLFRLKEHFIISLHDVDSTQKNCACGTQLYLVWQVLHNHEHGSAQARTKNCDFSC